MRNLIAFIVSLACWAFAIMCFHNWFISPVYGISIISYFQGLGLTFPLSLFKKIEIEETDNEDFEKSLIKSMALLLWTLIGFLIHCII